jgi:hypothetical protein
MRYIVTRTHRVGIEFDKGAIFSRVGWVPKIENGHILLRSEFGSEVWLLLDCVQPLQ